MKIKELKTKLEQFDENAEVSIVFEGLLHSVDNITMETPDEDYDFKSISLYIGKQLPRNSEKVST